MKIRFSHITVSLAFAFLSTVAQAQTASGGLDELDPFAPNIQQQLEKLDQEYYEQTGQIPYALDLMQNNSASCYRAECSVFAYVNKEEQRLYLYLKGDLVATWLVSTGAPGHGTPDFDTHPDGRIYDRYTSRKYPGGDFNGMGNMPFAVFIYEGFAIHGTGESNWRRLGSRASHGCVRLHPDNALQFNRLVREYGISDTWITVD